MRVPQADDIDKIMDLPLKIADKINTSNLLAKRYVFDLRQSNYYLEATEILGLASRRKEKYRLTDDGEKYILMDHPERKLMLIRKMIVAPIVSHVIAEIILSDKKVLTRDGLEAVIKESSKVGGSTVSRRAQTLIAWFKWLGDETGVFRVTGDLIRMNISK